MRSFKSFSRKFSDVLDISNKNLSSIPQSILTLFEASSFDCSPRVLNISHNKLNEGHASVLISLLEKCDEKNSKLEILDMSNNNIRLMISSLRRMMKLEPLSRRHFSKLRKVDVSHNSIWAFRNWMLEVNESSIVRTGNEIREIDFVNKLPEISFNDLFSPRRRHLFSSVKHMFFYEKSIIGNIPELLPEWVPLAEEIVVDRSVLRGSIPPTLGDLVRLTKLSLQGALLSGSILRSLGTSQHF